LVLLSLVLEKPREWIISHIDEEISAGQNDRLESVLARLSAGEPLAYITGSRAFYGLDFAVSPAVLIPRPETELLVEEAIQWLLLNPSRRGTYDVGTGSGAIAISLADAFPDLHITAVDISSEALEIARMNCARYHHEDQVTFLQNDLLNGLVVRADLITANLPYIPTATLDELAALRFEPRLALDGGKEGIDLITPLLQQSVTLCKPGGMILLEIESTISDRVIKLARTNFPEAQIDLLFDYANLPRIVKINR
jgi:release factor glutamine methyltransferase